MRFFAFSLIVLFHFFNFQTNAQATLKGKILNGNGIPISFIPPIHGNFFLSGYKEIQPDAAGNFSLDVPTDTTALIPFYCNKAFWRVIISPNDVDSVFVDMNKMEDVQFFGKNAKVNTFINTQLKREKYFSGLLDTPAERALMEEFSGPVIDYKISKMRDTETVVLQRFMLKNPINEVEKKIITSDIEYYHASLFNSLTLNAYRQSLKDKNAPFDANWGKTWDFVMGKVKIDNQDALGTYWYHDFVDKYIDWYRASFKKEIDVTKLDIRKGENIFEVEQMIRRSFTGRAREAVLADMIYEESLQGQMQPVLISIFDRFQEEYPESPYKSYLQKVIKPISENWAGRKDYIKDYVFEDIFLIDNQSAVQNFEQLMMLFKGKTVFVDLWATWCAPCKEEFRHKNELSKFTKGKNIEKLYISIDKDDKNEAWLQAVEFYDLGGHHIRASPTLMSDIRNRFAIDDKGNFSIPRYLIIDGTGQVVEKDAKRPSERQVLYEQIEKYLK
jgi:thiol-disulfide isomerase/thioredoxin